MAKDSNAVILRNVNLPEDQRQPMTVWQQKLFDEVKACLEIMDGNLMMPTNDLRDKLMEATGCQRSHAYKVILLARQAVGNRAPTAKLAVREEVMEMMRIEYQNAIKLGGAERIDAVVKIVNSLIKAYNLTNEEGETLNIAQVLEDNEMVVTMDPAVIGIKLTDKQRRDIARQRRKYLQELTDVEAVEVTDEEEEANAETV